MKRNAVKVYSECVPGGVTVKKRRYTFNGVANTRGDIIVNVQFVI